MKTGIGSKLRLSGWMVTLGACIAAGAAVAAAQDSATPAPLGSGVVRGQQPDGAMPPAAGMMMQGAGPGEALHGEIGEGRTVTGVPLTAEVVVTHDNTLGDGNRIHKENQTRLYRDSQGRIRREMTIELATPTTGNATRTMVMIKDPVNGKRYMLDPNTKTAREMPLKHGAKHGEGLGGHSPDGPHGGMQTKSVTEQDLGTKSINGFSAEGLRVTRTIAAGEIGNEKPIEVITERWYSPDLQLPVLITHTDPMMGSVTTKLTSVTRGEPDASLFQVPSDYKVVSGGPGEPFNVPLPPK